MSRLIQDKICNEISYEIVVCLLGAAFGNLF